MKQIQVISKESNHTKQLVQTHLNQLDIIEQYTKKKNLILKGVIENEEEDLEDVMIQLFLDKLKVDISKSEIEFVQRTEGDDPRYVNF